MSTNPFYSAYVEVLPEARGFRAALAKEFDTIAPEAGDRAGKGINSGILGSVGKLAAPLAGAIAALGLGAMLKGSITNASDFSEAGTAITAVFGDADVTIQKFAAGSAAALGQSTNMTLDAARVFGTFGKAAGLSGEDLAGFSTEFITLAGDLASFNNTTPEQAIEALGAGLRGESEPLRAYGVLLDDATLKARATELGIYSGTGALTQQQKVLASQAEIMAQTSLQQGDFAKTSGGLANQQRILSAGLENLSAGFGLLLLPAMSAVVGFVNTAVLPALTAFTSVLPDVFSTIGAAFNGEPPTAALGAWTGPVTTFGAALRTISDTMGPLLASYGEYFASIWGVVGQALGPLAGQFIELVTSFSPLSLILQTIEPLIPSLLGLFEQLATTLSGALGSALTTLMPVVQELATTLVGVLGGIVASLVPVIVDLVSVLGPVLSEVIGALMPVIVELASFIGPLLTTVLDALMPVIVMLATTIGSLLAAILPLLAPILSLIAPLVQLVGAILTPLIQLFAALLGPIMALQAPITDVLIVAIKFLVDILTVVIGAVASFYQWIADLVTGSGDAGTQLAAIWNQTMGMFSDFFTNTGGMFTDFFNNTVGMFTDFGSNVATAARNLWALVSTAFQTGIDTAVGFVTGLPGKVMAVLGNMGTFLVDAGKDLIQGFIDGIKGMIGAVGNVVGDVMDRVADFFPHSPAKRGVFSGSGWGAVFGAGTAIGAQFGAGLAAATPSLDMGINSLVAAPLATSFDASVYGSGASGGTAADRPITMDGKLFGIFRQLANGEAQIVVGEYDRAASRIDRMGWQV